MAPRYVAESLSCALHTRVGDLHGCGGLFWFADDDDWISAIVDVEIRPGRTPGNTVARGHNFDTEEMRYRTTGTNVCGVVPPNGRVNKNSTTG
jgi:hypothetical protein